MSKTKGFNIFKDMLFPKTKRLRMSLKAPSPCRVSALPIERGLGVRQCILYFLITSCHLLPKNKVSTNNENFLKLNNFYQENLNYLTQNQKKLLKYVTFNDSVYTIESKQVNWENELSFLKEFLIDANLNEPNWVKETQQNNSNIKKDFYNNKPKDQLKRISISYENNEISQIFFIVEAANMFNKSEIIYSFFPKKGYQINGNETKNIEPINTWDVHARFE